MCNIVKFNKNIKINEQNSLIKYLVLFKDVYRYHDFSSEAEALDMLKVLKAVNPDIKMFKSVRNKDGSNERMYSLEVLP